MLEVCRQPGSTIREEYPAGLDKQGRAEWLLQDLFRFSLLTGIAPDIEPQPHAEMCAQIQAMEPRFHERVQRKKLYQTPRYTFKTSLVEAEICRTILKWPDIAMGVFRANRELAAQITRNVQLYLTTNEVILDLWGDLQAGSKKWGEFEFVVNTRTKVQRDATLYAAGLRVTTTGMHLDRVFMDDLVTRENCDSIKEMQDARVLVQSMNPVLSPWGTALVTGTQWSSIDVYAWIKERNRKAIDKGEEPPFEEYIRTVETVDDSGTVGLFFPSRLSFEFLEQQRRELEARYYYAWYFNQTYEAGMKPFTKLNFFDGEYNAFPFHHVILTDEAYANEAVPLYVAVTIDPSLTGSNVSSDPIGINVIGFDSRGNWLVLESLELRKLPSDATFDIVDVLMRYEPDMLVVESANADAAMMSRIGQAIRDMQMKCSVVSYSALQDEPRGKRGKAQRILALEPLFREGRAFLRRDRWTAPLVRQLDMYPQVEHDDVLDALAMGRKAFALAPAPPERVPVDEGLECESWLDRMKARVVQGENAQAGVPPGAWTGMGAQKVG